MANKSETRLKTNQFAFSVTRFGAPVVLKKRKKKDLEHQLELKAPNPSKDYYSELSTFNMPFLRFLLQEQYGDSVGTNVMTIYSLKKVYMR
jgi:hypothetical protein